MWTFFVPELSFNYRIWFLHDFLVLLLYLLPLLLVSAIFCSIRTSDLIFIKFVIVEAFLPRLSPFLLEIRFGFAPFLNLFRQLLNLHICTFFIMYRHRSDLFPFVFQKIQGVGRSNVKKNQHSTVITKLEFARAFSRRNNQDEMTTLKKEKNTSTDVMSF